MSGSETPLSSSPLDDKPATLSQEGGPQAEAGPGHSRPSTLPTAAVAALLWPPPPGTAAPNAQHWELRKTCYQTLKLKNGTSFELTKITTNKP